MHMYSGSSLLLRLVPAGTSVAMRSCKNVRQACKAYSHIRRHPWEFLQRVLRCCAHVLLEYIHIWVYQVWGQ